MNGGHALALSSGVIEAELHDERFVLYMLGVWEREMGDFARGQAAARPEAEASSARELVDRSDANRYLTVARRVQSRRPTR